MPWRKPLWIEVTRWFLLRFKDLALSIFRTAIFNSLSFISNTFPYVGFLEIFHFLSFFFKFYLFIFRERGREGEREGEKHQCVVASYAPSTGDLAHNPGMSPDWKLNW